MPIVVQVANSGHSHYAAEICQMMADAAKTRGTGIAKREPEYVLQKMMEGKAVIALNDQQVIGFCYIESWENKKYVANSGLIVHPDYRNTGLARTIKKRILELSKELFPNSLLFGITTSQAVMKINSDLGYKPVTFSELTQDQAFWNGCQSCPNHDILQRTQKSMCLCTGMLYDPSKAPQSKADPKKAWENFKNFRSQRKSRIQKLIEKSPFLKQVFKQES